MSIYWIWAFFRAIQSFNDAAPKNKKEVIEAVSEVYNNYAHHKINQTWLTIQSCFNQIITHHGDNNYNIDHIRKEQLEQNGNLLMLWMWWRTWQTYATTMTQMMTTVTMTTLIRKKYLKLKQYPSDPHTSERMGAMARDCPIGVEIGIVVVVVVVCMSFPQRCMGALGGAFS